MQRKNKTLSGHKVNVRAKVSLFLALALGFAVACNSTAATLTWVGDDSNNLWDINTSQMWNDGSGAAVYNDGDTVTIDDSGSASPSIDLTAAVAPASVTVDNTTKNYTIAGAGSLAGTMPLNKSGTNTLSLQTANTFSGDVTVTGGILEFAPPSDVTMTNLFTGTGGVAFRKSGTSTLMIAPPSEKLNHDYHCGAVVVDGGILQFGTSGSHKYRGFYRATSYTVNSGATMDLRGHMNINIDAPVAINGGTLKSTGYTILGPLTLNGAIMEARNGAGGSYRSFCLHYNVTVTGSEPSIMSQTGSSNVGVHLAQKSTKLVKTFDVADVTDDTEADLTVSAVLVNSSQDNSVCGLAKAGAGTMVMSAANIYTGTTTVNDGTLLLSGSLASTSVDVNDGGTLLVSNSAPMPDATVTIAAGGTFGVAGTVASSVNNLTFAEGSKVSWTYDGAANTAGLVNVTGTLTLPSAATIDLSGTGPLRSGQVLFSATDGTVAGATDLSGWTINNVPESTSAKVVLVDKQVVLNVHRGLLILVF